LESPLKNGGGALYRAPPSPWSAVCPVIVGCDMVGAMGTGGGVLWLDDALDDICKGSGWSFGCQWLASTSADDLCNPLTEDLFC
jgi:hypothetical protein